MALGYDRPLYMLAFDHRGSFQKGLFGITGTPTAAEHDRIADAKRVILGGYALATSDGVPASEAGLLVDEQFGAGILRAAKDSGYTFAMPVEKSGQADFDFEFGESFGEQIEKFDPSFAKVLVRYNPDGDGDLNSTQAQRLVRLGDWLRSRGRKFLFELLVPAEPAQLEQVGGDADRYDRDVRPDLVVRAIAELQRAGVEPDIWKIEGLDRRADCQRVAVQARSGGRAGVACIVLGRGASAEAVVHWLKQAAGVDGYIGFAIGRTLWWDPLSEYVAGAVDQDEAARRIAAKYRRMVETYDEAAHEAVSSAGDTP